MFLFHEKMGTPTQNRPKGDVIWLHCDKMSESGDIIKQTTAAGLQNKTVLLTYNSIGAEPTANTHGMIIQRAPADYQLTMKRFLKFWEPSIAISVGSEIHPMRQAMLKKFNIPSFLINGHVSDGGYRKWKFMKRLARQTVRGFAFILAEDNRQALRLANLGAHNVKPGDAITGGNRVKEILKYS